MFIFCSFKNDKKLILVLCLRPTGVLFFLVHFLFLFYGTVLTVFIIYLNKASHTYFLLSLEVHPDRWVSYSSDWSVFIFFYASNLRRLPYKTSLHLSVTYKSQLFCQEPTAIELYGMDPSSIDVCALYGEVSFVNVPYSSCVGSFHACVVIGYVHEIITCAHAQSFGYALLIFANSNSNFAIFFLPSFLRHIIKLCKF